MKPDSHAAPETARQWERAAETAYRAALALILGAALWMRMANLMDVQNFNGDQGRDYLVVMDWLERGQWPLLGPDRAAVGDRTLGPGWFYTVAPAMALSGFHPAAGAATVALAAVLSVLLMAVWVRRATASRAAALVTGGVAAFSALWTEQGRMLWNPNMLPLGVAGLAWLIEALPRRPAAGLAGALGLAAILPQWHTTGLLVDGAAAAPLALAVWAVWPAARRAGWRTWAGWGAALAVVVGLLYVPPLLYELQPGPGNFISYFKGAALPAQPFDGGWIRRGWIAFDRLAGLTAYQLFFINPENMTAGAVAARLAVGGGCVAAFVMFFLKDLFNPQSAIRNPQSGAGGDARAPGNSAFRNPQSGAGKDACATFFLALLAGGFWLVLALKGWGVQDYCLIAPETALLMLGGWTAGRLLTAPARAGARLRLKKMTGAALLLGAGALCLGQIPRAWSVHQGLTPYRFTFRVTREVAAAIAKDAGGRPFSVELAEPYNFPAHYFYLLRWLGRPPLNEDYYAHAIARERMGERIYVIAAPGLTDEPALKGVAGPLTDRLQVRNVTIWRIDPARLAPGTRALRVLTDGSRWGLEAAQ